MIHPLQRYLRRSGEREGGRRGREGGREGGRRGREGGRRGREGGEGGREERGREGGRRGREGMRGREEREGRWREGRGRAREVTMGIGIFTESSNIPQEVCHFRSAPAERMEAEKLNKTLTEGKGCDNGR